MATLNQIKVNTGTEDNPSYVLHDVHDKRLDDGASSLVTTCTHLLATNAALSSFNPITSANLASVLGDVFHISQTTFFISDGGSYEMTGLRGCWILLMTTNMWDISAIVLASKPAGNVKVLGYHGGSSKTVGTESTNDVQIIHNADSETVTVKSNDMSRAFRVLSLRFE